MKHIVIDLEMNPINKYDEARAICKDEIIEIGAVMLDEHLHEIASFRTYVKPEYNKIIEHRITALTGIATEMVQNAPCFREALRMFTHWCLACGDDITVYAWSENDYMQISKEMALKNYHAEPVEARILSKPWSDFQHEFDTGLGFDRQLSLKMALDMAGLEFNGRAHDALDDARNTAELLQVFRDEARFNKTLRIIKETMEPTPCTNTLGDLFDFSMVECA